MGDKYKIWASKNESMPTDYEALACIIKGNRSFQDVPKLEYGDYGLEDAYRVVLGAIKEDKTIALYADYDVDGTMSCVSWIWFFEAIGFNNYTYYIPDRFSEGYGVNLNAVKHLVNDKSAEVIITMDTGITANTEASWCKEHGVDFICTDHHKIQPDKMPDCITLNPKMHPDTEYQELCGCGITFVLLRKLGKEFNMTSDVWQNILALTGMATICDVVPLNGVNHKLARQGIAALLRSQKSVLKKLLDAAAVGSKMDEKDVGFRLGPRINAVGRLEHAHTVVKAFIEEDSDDLIHYMGTCNEKRKLIQKSIVEEATVLAKEQVNDPILFTGGNWHPGVVGIAASKIAELFWRPVWLYEKKGGICKGSARSIPGFDVTEAMSSCKELFTKFGGHKAAGGYSFPEENEEAIRHALIEYAESKKQENPEIWQSKIEFDCEVPLELLELEVTDLLDEMKPFGHGFEEPRFLIDAEVESVVFYKDKQTGEPRHTALTIYGPRKKKLKVMFFNEVHEAFETAERVKLLATASKNTWRNMTSLSLMGLDYEIMS